VDLFETALTRYVLLTVSTLALAALGYVVFLAVRALFRQARGIARDAGHPRGSASLRAVLRMTVWAAFFGLYYFFAFTVGKRLGWWAVPLAVAALAGMIWCLLLADRLLTVKAGDVRQQAGIAVTVVGMLGLLAAGIVLATRS
jgi:predicted secreted protein